MQGLFKDFQIILIYSSILEIFRKLFFYSSRLLAYSDQATLSGDRLEIRPSTFDT